MKRHGPFWSPGHMHDHEPFFYSLGSCDLLAWIPPTVTPCGYGRLWGLGSAVWQQPDTRCAPWGSGIVQRWAPVVAKPRALCLAVDEQKARLGHRERDHRQLRLASANRDAALIGDWRQQHSLNLAWDAAGTAFG